MRSGESVADFIDRVVQSIGDGEFAYSLEVNQMKYDVYYTNTRKKGGGIKASVATRIDERNRAEVTVFCRGHISPANMTAKILAARAEEAQKSN